MSTYPVKGYRKTRSRRKPRRLEATSRLKASRVNLRHSDLLISSAERHGSDGRGRGGLTGYMMFLGRERPAQFARLLYKVLNAMVPRKRARRSAAGSAAQDNHFLAEAVLAAAERLGSDNRGKDGATGYCTFLATNRPKQFARLFGPLMMIQEAELQAAEAQAQWRERMKLQAEISAMTFEEKKARLRAMGVSV
jgi:hypothetical protein